MPDKMSEYMPERLQGRMSEDMSDRVPEYMSDRMYSMCFRLCWAMHNKNHLRAAF